MYQNFHLCRSSIVKAPCADATWKGGGPILGSKLGSRFLVFSFFCAAAALARKGPGGGAGAPGGLVARGGFVGCGFGAS